MNLVEAILLECDRVRALVPLYEECDTGMFAVYLMLETIKRATRAIADDDVTACVMVYEDLQSFHE